MIATDGMLLLFILDPWTPHMVENRSQTSAVLYEWSDLADESAALDRGENLRSDN
jgi:hypothetical protein